MPKFQVTVTDEGGHKLYDESIEAAGPLEACAKAVADAETADVAASEEAPDPAPSHAKPAGAGRGSDLRSEAARLAAEASDGELSATDVAAKVRRGGDLRAEMERLGMDAAGASPAATTYRAPD